MHRVALVSFPQRWPFSPRQGRRGGMFTCPRTQMSYPVYTVVVSTQDRIPVTVRLSIAGVAEIDRIAEEEERDRSSMVRILLKEALTMRQKSKR